MDEYEEYQKECARIKENNEILLKNFEEHLVNAGLAKKTIKNHLSNIDFYINEFLLYEDATPPEKGIEELSWFLGDWFIRKAMWASKASIKSNAASLKKFYIFLEQKGLVKKEELAELKETIKYEMEEWLASISEQEERYSDYW